MILIKHSPPTILGSCFVIGLRAYQRSAQDRTLDDKTHRILLLISPVLLRLFCTSHLGICNDAAKVAEDESRAPVDSSMPPPPGPWTHRLATVETGIRPLWTSELASSAFASLRLRAARNGATTSTCSEALGFPGVPGPHLWTKETVVYLTRGRPCSSGTSRRQLKDTSDAPTHSLAHIPPRQSRCDCSCARQQIRSKGENMGSTCSHLRSSRTIEPLVHLLRGLLWPTRKSGLPTDLQCACGHLQRAHWLFHRGETMRATRQSLW